MRFSKDPSLVLAYYVAQGSSVQIFKSLDPVVKAVRDTSVIILLNIR